MQHDCAKDVKSICGENDYNRSECNRGSRWNRLRKAALQANVGGGQGGFQKGGGMRESRIMRFQQKRSWKGFKLEAHWISM